MYINHNRHQAILITVVTLFTIFTQTNAHADDHLVQQLDISSHPRLNKKNKKEIDSVLRSINTRVTTSAEKTLEQKYLTYNTIAENTGAYWEKSQDISTKTRQTPITKHLYHEIQVTFLSLTQDTCNMIVNYSLLSTTLAALFSLTAGFTYIYLAKKTLTTIDNIDDSHHTSQTKAEINRIKKDLRKLAK